MRSGGFRCQYRYPVRPASGNATSAGMSRCSPPGTCVESGVRAFVLRKAALALEGICRFAVETAADRARIHGPAIRHTRFRRIEPLGQCDRQGGTGMDAWTQLRSAVTAQFAWLPRIGMAISPGIVTAAAVLHLWQLVGGWIAICGTTSAASAAFCFALAIAVAIAASLAQRYAPSRGETGMAITGVILGSWICPALIDEVFQGAINFARRKC